MMNWLKRLCRGRNEMGFIYVDLIDGSGGFMIPESDYAAEAIKELLKDSKYILRDREVPSEE